MRFGTKWALRNLSLHVPKACVTGLLGANGAGKSTTMRIVAGCLVATAGQVLIGGVDVRRTTRKAQALIGYLPEAASGFSGLTPGELLRYCGESRGLSGKQLRRRVGEVCDAINLRPALNTPLSQLSKGWRQRAWLAQSVLHDPPVLVLDEPTDGLDPNQKAQLREFIRQQAASKSIILSTHILEEAEYLCDRIAMIDGGQVVAEDRLEAFADEHKRLHDSFSRWTQGALGDAAIGATEDIIQGSNDRGNDVGSDARNDARSDARGDSGAEQRTSGRCQ